mmetsp:Transcript_16964/g.33109  ORF Transcript_16964/g.33109 Transcript_16964/m.33109 type:complete len:149 (-) Transcript_16964:283-729(-)
MGVHGKPPAGLSCKATWEDITEEDGNYCEYLSMPSGQWLPSQFSADTVRHLLRTQYGRYLEDVEKAAKDCAAAVRRLVARGPPVYLSDSEALPLAEGDSYIEKIWFADEDCEVSAKLEGALEGEEREELWNSQRETLRMMEAAEASSE